VRPVSVFGGTGGDLVRQVEQGELTILGSRECLHPRLSRAILNYAFFPLEGNAGR
jgi:hypothetical protein